MILGEKLLFSFHDIEGKQLAQKEILRKGSQRNCNFNHSNSIDNKELSFPV
jgi:hypothetical protein